MVPRLPKSLLQAPGGGIALVAAGSLGWDDKLGDIPDDDDKYAVGIDGVGNWS
jgi:hypothetical protein